VPTRVSAKPRKAKRAQAAEIPTRELILDTAERLFARHGFDGLTLRDLAQAMELTAPSLYNHFASKQALYDAVLARGLQPIVDIIQESWSADVPDQERIGRTLTRLLEHLAQHPHLAPLMQRALLDESHRGLRLLSRWLRPMYRTGVGVIEQAARRAGWTEEELPQLALALFGMVFAYFTNVNALRALAPQTNPFRKEALEIQRQMLEKAVYRLLISADGGQPSAANASRKKRKPS